MKNLRLYQTDGDYTSDPITREYPTVSYCKETDTVHIEKRPSYFIGTYNVTSTSRTTNLLGSNSVLSKIKEMYIDNVKQETVVGNYTFATTGKHTVKCVMMDNITSMSDMFYKCSGLTSLDLSNFNTSNVTSMGEMFQYCSGLTSLDLTNFDTSNVTSMSRMFDRCTSLTSITFGDNFNTSNVTDMEGMFLLCCGLTSLDLNKFNTSKVTNMNVMFSDCTKLTSLDLSNFDTSKVTDMTGMFDACKGLTSLDLSNFNTSNVTNMNFMFANCSGLISITFGSQANVGKVTSYNYMFNNITTTGTLYYPSAYADVWNNIIVTNQSTSYFPSTWTATSVNY